MAVTVAARTLANGASQLSKSRATCTRGIFTSGARRAVTPFKMPAMSPTMTEGGISSWKKQSGEAFTAGDILLEIETDKATMDVEAQDDGIMGKILLQDGSKNVPVGKIIAMLAEEGDDISNIEVPAEESSEASKDSKSSASSSAPPPSSSSTSASSSSPTPPAEKPSHSGPVKNSSGRPLFPSVLRLLQENGVSDTKGIKGTGLRKMITKGDVLAHLGKISSPWGSAKPLKMTANGPVKEGDAAAPTKEANKPQKVYDAETVRTLILSGLTKSTQPAAPVPSAPLLVSFDDIVKDYLPTPSTSSTSALPPLVIPTRNATTTYFDGLI